MRLSKWHLVHASAWLVALLAVGAGWWGARAAGWTDPETLRRAFEPYRTSWTGLPLALGVFVVAELVCFPLLVLVVACGLVFGPWLGGVYAFVGALASAVLPFLIGRRLGRQRLLRWGGAPARRMVKILERKGVIAVFLARKIPAPYSMVNMVCGASGVALHEFLLGTALGIVTGVVLLMAVGANLGGILQHPQPRQVALALGMLTATIVAVLLLQRVLNRRAERPR
jgi:uncharacterized membrane protein YdjX (TVP38/TMEM64 family)